MRSLLFHERDWSMTHGRVCRFCRDEYGVNQFGACRTCNEIARQGGPVDKHHRQNDSLYSSHTTLTVSRNEVKQRPDLSAPIGSPSSSESLRAQLRNRPVFRPFSRTR